MRKRLLIFCLLAGMLLPCLLPGLGLWGSAATDDTETEPLPEETSGFTKDTYLMTEVQSLMSPSSGSTYRWTGTYPGESNDTLGKDADGKTVYAYDPEDATRRVAFTRYAPQTNASSFSLKYCKLSPDHNLLLSSAIWLPDASQASIALAPTAVKAELYGTTLFTLTENGNRYGITFANGTTGSVPKGAWVRVAVFYDAVASTVRVSVTGDLTDANGASCTRLLAENIACSFGNRNTFRYIFSIPAKTADNLPTCGMFHRTSMCIPGDMYLLSAGLEAIEGDKALNTHRDGTLTLTFSHDIDPTELSLSAIHVTDADGNALAVTGVTHSARLANAIILDFSGNPLPKFTTVLVHYNAGVTDFAGQALAGDTYTIVDVYGDAGELRPKIPIVEIPEDQHIMPDIYNTGYRCAEEDLEPLLQKYPLLADNMGYGGNSTTVNITDAVAAAYNYHFEKFTYTGSLRFTGTHPITIEDAYLHCETQHYAIENVGSAYLTISYLEGTGSKSAYIQGGNMKLSHIYLHDVGADHMKAGSNQWLEYSYFRDGGTRNPGAHADCIQFSGTPNEIIDNIIIIGNRMDVPALLWDHVANSTLFFKTENYSSGFTNVQMIGNWLNGGGITAYLTIDSSTEAGVANTRYITFKDNQFGYGGRWGMYGFGKKYWPTGVEMNDYGGEFSGNGRLEALSAGSVLLRDGNGNTVTDLVSVTGGTLTVDVHFANYLLAARQYRIAVRVLTDDGAVIAEKTADGQIRRYIHYNEYATEDNIEDVLDENGNPITFTDGAGNIGRYQRLINLPDLPEDVLGSITVTGLPTNLAGCHAEVVVYDTTDTTAREIRTADFTASGTYQPALRIAGASLTLNARPQLNFYVDKSVLAGLPSGATLYLTDDAGNCYDGIASEDYMTFSIADIPAPSIGTEGQYRLEYTVAGSESGPIQSSITVRYSPLTYAIHMYGKAEAETALGCENLRALLIALVQYADAAGSTGAKDRFALETGYTWAGTEYGDYDAIRERNTATAVTWDEEAGAIASVGAMLSGSIDLHLTVRDTRYTRISATIGGETLRTLRDGSTLTVGGLYASDLYGAITFVFSGEDVPEVTATLTVVGFLDGYSGGENEALARATAIYMDAALTFATAK